MNRYLLATSVASTLAVCTPALSITVDGAYDSDYGAAKSTVIYNPAAPTSNFDAPTNQSSSVGYNVYLADQGGFVYGLIQANTTLGGAPVLPIFANLYFGDTGLSPPARGSVIGFEITNERAFTPGVNGYAASPINFKTTATSIEFALPESYFTSSIGGLASAGFMTGDTVALRLSQTFGYSVNGGQAFYGDNRLGAVTLAGGAAAVPGPLAGAGLVPLLGLVGGWVARRRRRRLSAA